MRDYFFALILVISLSACSAFYQKYVPAPHEMTIDANFVSHEASPIEEEKVKVHDTQPIKLRILQSLMKTRGFIYIGYKNVILSSSPSISCIQKAASEIGATHALYFIESQKSKKEKKSEINAVTLTTALAGAKNRVGYQSALERGLKPKEYVADVVYSSYFITYWKKSEKKEFNVLKKEEVQLLKEELKELSDKIKNLKSDIVKLKKRKEAREENITNTQSNQVLDLNKEINSQLKMIYVKIERIKKLKEEIKDALNKNKSRLKNKPRL